MTPIRQQLPDDQKTFSQELNEFLKESGYSGMKAAAMVGTSTKSFYAWQSGKRVPPKRIEILTQEDVLEILRRHRKVVSEAKIRFAKERSDERIAAMAAEAAGKAKTDSREADKPAMDAERQAKLKATMREMFPDAPENADTGPEGAQGF